MGAVVLRGCDDARVVTIAVKGFGFLSVEWRFGCAFPTGRVVVQAVGEVNDRMVGNWLGHGHSVLGK